MSYPSIVAAMEGGAPATPGSRELAPPLRQCPLKAMATSPVDGLTRAWAIWKAFAVFLAIVSLTNCAFLSHHHFASPAKEWEGRTGQLQYRNAGMTVVG